MEEATDDVRGLRAEVSRLTDALLAEERKVNVGRPAALYAGFLCWWLSCVGGGDVVPAVAPR